jgi:hypothetical protein
MNDFGNAHRAQITAMLLRVISELAGGDPELDRAVGKVLSGVSEICHGSKVKGSRAAGQAAMQVALESVTNKDWRLTITKTGQVFELEAEFGESVHGNC